MGTAEEVWGAARERGCALLGARLYLLPLLPDSRGTSLRVCPPPIPGRRPRADPGSALRARCRVSASARVSPLGGSRCGGHSGPRFRPRPTEGKAWRRDADADWRRERGAGGGGCREEGGAAAQTAAPAAGPASPVRVPAAGPGGGGGARADRPGGPGLRGRGLQCHEPRVLRAHPQGLSPQFWRRTRAAPMGVLGGTLDAWEGALQTQPAPPHGLGSAEPCRPGSVLAEQPRLRRPRPPARTPPHPAPALRGPPPNTLGPTSPGAEAPGPQKLRPFPPSSHRSRPRR